jgi:hypothetical protein
LKRLIKCLGKGDKYRISDKYPKVKRPLARHIQSWDDNIKVDLKEIWHGLNLSGSG